MKFRILFLKIRYLLYNFKYNIFRHRSFIKCFDVIIRLLKWLIYILIGIGLFLSVSTFPFLLEKLTHSSMKISDWSNYFSNIFGAAIALLGVFFTIEHQKKYFNRLPYRDQIKTLYSIIHDCKGFSIGYKRILPIIQKIRLMSTTQYDFLRNFQRDWNDSVSYDFSNFEYSLSSNLSQLKLIEKSRDKKVHSNLLAHNLQTIGDYCKKCQKSIDYLNRVNNIFQTSFNYKMKLQAFNLIKYNLSLLAKYLPRIYKQNILMHKQCSKLLK